LGGLLWALALKTSLHATWTTCIKSVNYCESSICGTAHHKLSILCQTVDYCSMHARAVCI